MCDLPPSKPWHEKDCSPTSHHPWHDTPHVPCAPVVRTPNNASAHTSQLPTTTHLASHSAATYVARLQPPPSAKQIHPDGHRHQDTVPHYRLPAEPCANTTTSRLHPQCHQQSNGPPTPNHTHRQCTRVPLCYRYTNIHKAQHKPLPHHPLHPSREQPCREDQQHTTKCSSRCPASQ